MNDQPRTQRTRLGAELRRMRKLAGLSGREISRRTGISQTSVSRIENGEQVPSLPQTRAWCTAVEASEQVLATLTSLAESALNEVETWRTRMRAGLPAMQQHTANLEVLARTMRGFQPVLVPGLLQTAEYARHVFNLFDSGEDHAAAIAARMDRQQALYETSRQFEFILTEAALRWRPGPREMLVGQIHRIATVATLSNVTVGVIDSDAVMHAAAWCGFDLHEDHDDGRPAEVLIELPHAGLTVTDPDDVKTYSAQLDLLRQSALWGKDAVEALWRIQQDISE